MTQPQFDQQNLRGARRAVCRMNPKEREIFLAMRFEDTSYEDLALRLGISVSEVEAHFASSITIFVRVMRAEERPWWQFWRR